MDDEMSPEKVRERLRRRAVFLRELAEARELRKRVSPRRSRQERIRATLLHDGTVISYPGVKNERIEAESPEATNKFIESTLLAPRD